MEGWTIMKFSDFACTSSKMADPTVAAPEIRCIELEHINSENGQLLGWVSPKGLKSQKKVFESGDILFGKLRPYLRKFLYTEFSGLCSGEFWVIKANPRFCEQRYLYYVVQTNHFIGEANKSSGTKMPRADWKLTSSAKFPLPPLPEQRKIAEILSTWEEAIEKLDQLIEKKKLLKKGLMQQLLTGKKRFPGFTEPWKEVRLGDVLKEVKRKVSFDDNADYPLISLRRRSGGAFLRETRKGQDILVKDLRIANKGDFLISKMQVVHGASGIVPDSLNGAFISGSYICYIAKDPEVCTIPFIGLLSTTPMFYRLTFLSSYGVHIEKMTFNQQDFLRKTVLVPPSCMEQKTIEEFFGTIESDLLLLTEKLKLFKEQKKGLMQQLLTGKKRVKL